MSAGDHFQAWQNAFQASFKRYSLLLDVGLACFGTLLLSSVLDLAAVQWRLRRHQGNRPPTPLFMSLVRGGKLQRTIYE